MIIKFKNNSSIKILPLEKHEKHNEIHRTILYYYSSNPSEFIEAFFNIKLLLRQKLFIRCMLIANKIFKNKGGRKLEMIAIHSNQCCTGCKQDGKQTTSRICIRCLRNDAVNDNYIPLNKDYISSVIKALDELKSNNPAKKIFISTPNGCASCKIGDAQIYRGNDNEIIIDV